MNCMIWREKVKAVAAGSSTSQPALSASVIVPPFTGVVAVVLLVVWLLPQAASSAQQSKPRVRIGADTCLRVIPSSPPSRRISSLAREALGFLAGERQCAIALELQFVDHKLAVLHYLGIVDPVGVETAGEVMVGAAAGLALLEDAQVGTEGDLHIPVVALVILAGFQPVGPLLTAPSDVGDPVRVGIVELLEPLVQQVGLDAA